MNFYYQNEKLTLEEVITGNLDKNILSKFVQSAFNFIKKWHSDYQFFDFVTSGSTGPSKDIKLSRTQMLYSAKTSMTFLDPNHHLKSCILCIQPTFIGGAMALVRSLENDLDVYLIEPDSSPIIASIPPSIISMVPMQIMNLLDLYPQSFKSIQTLLIGGARLPEQYLNRLRELAVNAYITYGMTETASHIALMDIQSEADYFHTIGDVEITTDKRSCLKIKGTITHQEWLQTNDVVELISGKAFQLVGRSDLIINTGGFKVNPELIETLLQPKIDCPFILASKKDDYLGQKIILLIESKEPFELDNTIFDQLHPYAKPKEIHFIANFSYTKSGKIDRFATATLV